jgi:hypothetical protein
VSGALKILHVDILTSKIGSARGCSQHPIKLSGRGWHRLGHACKLALRFSFHFRIFIELLS